MYFQFNSLVFLNFFFFFFFFLFVLFSFTAQQSSPLTRVSCTAHLTSSSFLHERATMTRDLEGSSTRNVGLVNPTWLDRPRDLKRPPATVSCCCCSNPPLLNSTLLPKITRLSPTPTPFFNYPPSSPLPPPYATAAAAVAPSLLDYISLGWAQLVGSNLGGTFSFFFFFLFFFLLGEIKGGTLIFKLF